MRGYGCVHVHMHIHTICISPLVTRCVYVHIAAHAREQVPAALLADARHLVRWCPKLGWLNTGLGGGTQGGGLLDNTGRMVNTEGTLDNTGRLANLPFSVMG